MTDPTRFEERLSDAYARYVAVAPVEVDGRVVASTLATGRGTRLVGWPGIAPRRRVGVLLAVGLVAALVVATAVIVGSHLTIHPPAGGQLAYSLNDDIYLAEWDGANPRRVADGVPWSNDAGGGPSYLFGDGGPAWAPDGRHFLFFDISGTPARPAGHIADASGHVVASIPDIWVDATWSPDSTRIEAWTGSAWIGATQISIYGVDGAVQESLPLPAGYVRSRESVGVWAADGRSVYVRLGGGPIGIWQLPLDGSVPARPAQNDFVARLQGGVTFSPDRNRMVWTEAGSLFEAKADGTGLRRVAVVAAGAARLSWSPDGTMVAYEGSSAPETSEIHIVDLGSETDATVVTDLHTNGPGLLGWSRAGDQVLFAGLDQTGLPSIWSVDATGSDRKVIVPGAAGGEWQPDPPP